MAKVKSLTTIVRDGMHNAFTDFVYWQGAYWVSYRKGASHISADSCCAVAVSSDRKRFMEVAHIRVPGDNRDPKLVVMDNHRLAMVFPAWQHMLDTSAPDAPRVLRQYVAFSDNGYDWQTPIAIGPLDRWLWRVRQCNGVYYGLSYGPAESGQWEQGDVWVALVSSYDLIEWQHVAWVNPDGPQMNECDLLVRPDGEMWIVGRGIPDGVFGRAMPPYTTWQLKPLGHNIHAPVVLEHEGEVYVAGRCRAHDTGNPMFPYGNLRTLGLFRLDHGSVTPLLHLPANADCSYAGMGKDAEGRICMSYYSGHAYWDGVLEPAVEPEPGQKWTYADVFFAELELP